MKFTPTWMNYLFFIGVTLMLFFLQPRPTTGTSSSAAFSFWRFLDDLVCHVPCAKRSVRCQVTDLSYTMIDWVIPLLGAGTELVPDAHGLVNLPEALPPFIIFPLNCQATLLLPNLQGFCCPLADSNSSVPGPGVDLLSRHLDCISIWDNWYWQAAGITLHLRFSTVLSEWVVDIKSSLL